MNRTGRLLSVLLQMQSRRSVRAEDLAAHFETSKRAIHRGIHVLRETGVPVVAQPWIAAMLVLGAECVTGSFDAQYGAAVSAARGKIEALLRPQTRDDRALFRNASR